MKKIVAFRKYTALILVITIVSLGLVPFIRTAQAGTFTPAKVTISDSRAGFLTATYDFAFTATVTTNIKQLTVEFCDAPSGACVLPTGMISTGATRASDNIAGVDRTDTFNVNGTLTTVVTTPAEQATQAITVSYTGIKNPTTINTTYYAHVTTYSDEGTTEIDTATVAFAILSTTSIAVSADVGSTFLFTIAAANTGSVNGEAITITSAANTIPFGVLTSGEPAVAAHDLSVVCNAIGGYTITVKTLADPPLVDGSNNIDKFTGTNASPATWSAPDGTVANTNTGFFGYTTNDDTLGTGTPDRFTGNKWSGATTSPLELVYHAVATSSAQLTRVGWQSEVNGIQPPGSYTGTVILVATPTY